MENEEYNDNDMSLFDSNLELNFDIPFNVNDTLEEDDETNLENNQDEKNKLIDENDNSQESVDEEDEDKDEGSSDDDTSPNLYSSFTDVLYEQGIIPSLESSKDIKSIDDLAEVVKREIEAQSELRLQQTLENLDLEKIAISKKAQIELDKVDEDYLKDNLEYAKNMILQDYLNQGLSEDRARKMLRKTIDLGEDVIIEEAIESKTSLQEFEKRQQEVELANYKQRVEAEAKQQEEINNSIKNYIFNSKEVIQGIPNTKILQEKVFKSMTEPVAKNPETGEMMNKFMSDRSKDPIKFDTTMYYLYELTNGFTNLGNIKQTLTSSAVKKLENTLRKTKFEDNGTPAYLQDPNSYGGIGSELVL